MQPVDCPPESTPQAEEVRATRLDPRTHDGSGRWQQGAAPMNAVRGAPAREFAAQQRTRLLKVAKRICRNAADAEDLVQETLSRFIHGFGERETLPHERACESWLSSTLTNLFNDQCRRQRVQENRANDPTLSQMVQATPEPLAPPVYDSITREQFGQAIHALPPKKRAALDLHVSGKSYAEIGKELGISSGTARKRLHDARDMLRKLLQPFLPPGGH